MFLIGIIYWFGIVTYATVQETGGPQRFAGLRGVYGTDQNADWFRLC